MTSRYRRWEDAMIAQQRISEFYKTTLGENYLKYFFEDVGRRLSGEDRFPIDLLVAMQTRMILDSEPIYVAPEAWAVVDEARREFEPEPALPGDPFTPSGFALFPEYFRLHDMPVTPDKPFRSPVGALPVRAMAWTSLHDEDMDRGVFWIGMYCDVDDDLELDGGYVRWTQESAGYMRSHQPLSLVHQFQWHWGECPFRDKSVYEKDSVVTDGEVTMEEAIERGVEQAALVQSFWRIASQFVPGKYKAPRGIRRDYSRRVKPLDDMLVVTLRRTRDGRAHPPEEGNGEGHHYTVQFPVRGHWRNQWYPSLGEHRQKWIAPYMKGPEDAPVRMAEGRVWEFTR